MTHHSNQSVGKSLLGRTSALTAIVSLTALSMIGCKKKAQSFKSQQAPMASQAQAYSAPSRRLQPSDLGLVQGVEFPVERIPDDADAARAAASLANAIKSGNADALGAMLDPADDAVLEHLVDTGAWGDSAAATQIVRISSIEPAGDTIRIGLALQDDHGAYLLGWQGEHSRGAWQFSSLPVKSQIASRAMDLDGAALEEMNIPVAGPVVKEAEAKRPPVDKNKRARPRKRSTRPGGLGG